MDMTGLDRSTPGLKKKEEGKPGPFRNKHSIKKDT
jgi:hypothetical protein